MKIWKELGKVTLAFVMWMAVFILLAWIDEMVGCWITDHEITKIMVQCIVQGAAVIVLLCMKSKTITAIVFNIFVLVMLGVVTEEGMAHSMAIVMMLGVVPIHLREKGGE